MQGAEVEFRHVSKHYGGGEIGHNAVDDLSLVVPPGEICVLVGPSGCGKTTSLKMVNRLVEPTAGEVLIDGQDVAAAETTALRRRVGYVIQQIGLFPHQTIAENVATVPRLLDWPGRKIDARVDELLELVGLDPRRVRRRYPAQLSGGERQRVGVARALAAEPPVMLMDEPFGAVDPIVRARLQDEFLRIHQRLNTTVLFVTHDVDEAIKMGDRVAVMELGGRLAQFAPPSEILARPASEFVARFVGADRALKRLALVTVGAVQLQPLQALEADMPKVTPDTPLRDALAELIGAGARAALVVDSSGTPLGRLSLDAILAAARTDPEDERDAAAV